MLNRIKLFFICLTAMQIVGCTGLAEMKTVKFIGSVESEKAMVNIVMPLVVGTPGAVKAEMWDGDKFIGTLSAGSMIQYKTDPGNHTFMVNAQGNWGVARGELNSGKTYYLKFNGGIGSARLGVASRSDPRVFEWKNLIPTAIDEDSAKPLPKNEIGKAKKILRKVEDGRVRFITITSEAAR
jgi:hypothetical protein